MNLAKITNYGEYLERFPPQHEVRNLREHRLELRARSGPLERKLRLQLGRARGMESGMARARCVQALDGCAMKLRQSTKNGFAAI